MNYITKNNVIVIAQGVPKQLRKDQHPVKLQQSQSMPIHKRARPPIMSTKIKYHITSFQPPRRI